VTHSRLFSKAGGSGLKLGSLLLIPLTLGSTGRRALLGVLLFVLGSAVASEVNRAINISKRLQLLDQQLSSETAATAAESDNHTAKQFLQQAQANRNKAMKALETGSFDEAHQRTNMGLRAWQAVAEELTTGSRTSQEILRRNESLRNEITTYLQAFNSALQGKGPSSGALLNQGQIRHALDRSKALESSNKARESNRLLKGAHQRVILALTQLRKNDTVVYDKNFQTPADEYRYERNRYKSYLELSKKILQSDRINASKGALFKNLLKKSLAQSKAGKIYQGNGDYDAAIEALEQANDTVIKGLRMMGLPIYQ